LAFKFYKYGLKYKFELIQLSFFCLTKQKIPTILQIFQYDQQLRFQLEIIL